MFGCNIAHRGSVALSCMLYKIRYNPMLALYGASHSTIYSAVVVYYVPV